MTPIPKGGCPAACLSPHGRLESRRADVAELVDAHGSGPCAFRGVEVQVLSSASEDGAERPRFFAPYERAASTSSACVCGSTLRMAFNSVPSGPITNVERSTPMYFLPNMDFSTHTS